MFSGKSAREREQERERERERERETYLLLQEVARTFFIRRLRGWNRESRGERKRKSGGERKKVRKMGDGY